MDAPPTHLNRVEVWTGVLASMAEVCFRAEGVAAAAAGEGSPSPPPPPVPPSSPPSLSWTRGCPTAPVTAPPADALPTVRPLVAPPPWDVRLVPPEGRPSSSSAVAAAAVSSAYRTEAVRGGAPAAAADGAAPAAPFACCAFFWGLPAKGEVKVIRVEAGGTPTACTSFAVPPPPAAARKLLCCCCSRSCCCCCDHCSADGRGAPTVDVLLSLYPSASSLYAAAAEAEEGNAHPPPPRGRGVDMERFWNPTLRPALGPSPCCSTTSTCHYPHFPSTLSTLLPTLSPHKHTPVAQWSGCPTSHARAPVTPTSPP